MEDLAGKLLAAIAVTERIAQEACGRGPEWAIARERPVPWGVEPRPAEILASGKPIMRLYVEYAGQAAAEHVALHDPAAVLRHCASDRKTVERYYHLLDRAQRWRDGRALFQAQALDDVLRDLAEGYGIEVGE